MNALRALVVAGEDNQRQFLRATLETCGIDCSEAHDGIDALKFASDYGIDLVVTAIHLPRLGGLELLDLTRRGVFGNNSPPVIVCIGPLDNDDFAQSQEIRSCSGVLAASATREQVIDAVFAALGEA